MLSLDAISLSLAPSRAVGGSPQGKREYHKGKNYASGLYKREAKLEKYDRQGRAEENKAIHLKSDIKESKYTGIEIKSPRGLESLSRIILLTCNIS